MPEMEHQKNHSETFLFCFAILRNALPIQKIIFRSHKNISLLKIMKKQRNIAGRDENSAWNMKINITRDGFRQTCCTFYV